MNEPQLIHDLLAHARTIAVVGISEDARKPSHYVSRYMQQAGYRILPVNPSVTEVLGERCYASLSELPAPPDIVNVFRLPKFIPAIVDEMMALRHSGGGWDRLWVQLGIVNEAAAAQAEAAGIQVVMNRCILVEHQKLVQELTRK